MINKNVVLFSTYLTKAWSDEVVADEVDDSTSIILLLGTVFACLLLLFDFEAALAPLRILAIVSISKLRSRLRQNLRSHSARAQLRWIQNGTDKAGVEFHSLSTKQLKSEES